MVNELGEPTEYLDGDIEWGAPRWAQLVAMLWAISRARRSTHLVTRYSAAATELVDMFETYQPDAEQPDTRAVWLSMGRNRWWSTDLYPDLASSLADVERADSQGGLSRRAAQLVANDSDCAEAVYSLVSELEWTPTLEELLEVLAFSDFIEFEAEPTVCTEWPGVLDVDSAWGSQVLSDAVSNSDWDTALSLIDESIRAGRNLVNTWRPGGVSWSTPLHQAARHGAPESVIRALLRRGAWKSLVDANGDSALEIAMVHGNEHLADLLEPPETTIRERAVFKCLERHFMAGIGLILADERLPRMRPPSLEILAESDELLTFSPAPQWAEIMIWVESEQLHLAHWWGESRENGSEYICDVDGKWTDREWNGFRDGELEIFDDAARDDDERGEQDETDPENYEGDHQPLAPESRTALIYSGRRIVTGTSASSGLVYVICPRAKFESLLRMPELQGSSIGIAVTRDGDECAWTLLGRRWRQHIPALRNEGVGGGWTDLILFSAIFRRKTMNAELERLVTLEALSGETPDSNPSTVDKLVAAVGPADASALARRWRLLARSVAKHGLTPTTFPDSDEIERMSVVAEPGGAHSNHSSSVLGRHKEFVEPLEMTLRTPTLSAVGFWDGNTMLVKAGSQAARNHTKHQENYYVNLQRKLIAAGKLVSSGSNLVFAQDHRFDSPTAAANIVKGSSLNGREAWLDPDGLNINDHEGGVRYTRSNS